MKLILTGDGEYALSFSEAERIFLVNSLVMSLTHTGDAEYEIATGCSKDAADRYLELLRRKPGATGEYEISLAQSDLNFILAVLNLCVTHVSEAEYEIVVGRRKAEGSAELTDLEDQAENAFGEWIRKELDRKGAWPVLLSRMGDLSLLADEVLADRLAAEASELGKAISAAERQRAIVQQAKIDALLAELGRRGADVDGILAGLLSSDDPGVRLMAASNLLGSNPAARLTMEALVGREISGLSSAAGLALRRLRQRKTRNRN